MSASFYLKNAHRHFGARAFAAKASCLTEMFDLAAADPLMSVCVDIFIVIPLKLRWMYYKTAASSNTCCAILFLTSVSIRCHTSVRLWRVYLLTAIRTDIICIPKVFFLIRNWNLSLRFRPSFAIYDDTPSTTFWLLSYWRFSRGQIILIAFIIFATTDGFHDRFLIVDTTTTRNGISILLF